MYGWRGMNLAFAWRMRSLHRLKPWVMFHEVAVSTDRGQTFKRKILGHAQHMMVRWVASAAAKRWVSIPGWEAYLGLIAPAFGACEWLPVPSNVATHADPLRVAALRNSLAPDSTSRIVAHFGTFDNLIVKDVEPAVVRLLQSDSRWHALFAGRNSDTFAAQLGAKWPELKARVHATGLLSADAVAEHLMCADVVFQPFPDGISSRRGSAMAALALGLPIITTTGNLTEPIWRDKELVVFADVRNQSELQNALHMWSEDTPQRRALMERAKKGYEAHFSWDRIAEILRG